MRNDLTLSHTAILQCMYYYWLYNWTFSFWYSRTLPTLILDQIKYKEAQAKFNVLCQQKQSSGVRTKHNQKLRHHNRLSNHVFENTKKYYSYNWWLNTPATHCTCMSKGRQICRKSQEKLKHLPFSWSSAQSFITTGQKSLSSPQKLGHRPTNLLVGLIYLLETLFAEV